MDDLQEPALKKPKMSSTSDDDKPPRYKRRKIAIFFAYCGVGYQGMQKNPGAITIEGDLEEALYLSGAVPEADRGQPKRFDWARSARTDKGVSAVGQVVSGRFYVDPPGFVERLNSNLSPQIRIFGYKRVTPSFSAKKFCDRRRYVYLLPVFALDSSCHRDRESVLASLGSENELVKCLECSERGRKVVGLMGNKRDWESQGLVQSGTSSPNEAPLLGIDEKEKKGCNVENDDGVGEEPLKYEVGVVNSEVSVQSGISSNSEAALLSNDEEDEKKEKEECSVSVENGNDVEEPLKDDVVMVDSEVLVQSGILSNSEAALLTSKVKEKGDSNGVSDLNSGSANGDERSASDLNGCGNGEEGRKEKRCEFKYGDEEKERFNRLLKHYEGTHNFHNFTTRTKAEDPSAKRYIVSFEANTTLTIEGIEFVKCEVVGQSFMLHQIRKMMGLAVAVMRNFAPESIYDTAFRQDVHINVPTAPEVGLYLDECLFTSYNNRWKDSHEELSMKDYAEEAEEFKLKYIYSHVAKTEHKEGAVAVWLHSLNHRNYPDLRHANNGEVERAATDDDVKSATNDEVKKAAEGDAMDVRS